MQYEVAVRLILINELEEKSDEGFSFQELKKKSPQRCLSQYSSGLEWGWEAWN